VNCWALSEFREKRSPDLTLRNPNCQGTAEGKGPIKEWRGTLGTGMP
jgi:hypothetical protein